MSPRVRGPVSPGQSKHRTVPIDGSPGWVRPMTRLRMSDAEWEIAKTVCTAKQLAAMDYRRRGVGWKTIGRLLGVHPSTAKGHVEAGSKRLEQALEELAA